MNTDGRISGTESILRLEIIYLLTGEVYLSEAKSTGSITPINHACVCKEQSKNQCPIIDVPPPTLAPKKHILKKILEVAQKIIDLLTGEVPIRCQDVTVYFSMEEWEYIEGYKDLYKDAMMEHRLPLTSPDGPGNRNPSQRCPHSKYSWDSIQEHHKIPQNDKAKEEGKKESDEMKDLNIVVVEHLDDQEDLYMKIKEEEVPSEISTGHKVGDEIGSDGSYGTTTSSQHVNIAVSKGDKATCQPKLPNSSRGGKEIIKRRTKHSEERPFICAYCGKQFNFKSVFINHQRIHTGEKPYQCAECGKCFSQKGSMVEHQKIHKGEKPFVCPDCGKSFIQRANLYHHQKNHMNEKPYPCSECDKRFINSSRLAAHQKIHSGYKPFSCPDCGKSFIKNANLVIHQRVHTGEKPFMCSECGKCFIKNSNLVTHMRVHTGEKPFRCIKCGRCFSQSSVLVRHQKTHGDSGELVKVKV
ncbi:uncharacterized protein LOC143956313 [Lithobates pipiens]